MSTNSDVIRESYSAFHRGDLDGALTAFAPDIEWTHPDGMSEYGLGGTKRGLDEVKAFMAHSRTIFSALRPDPYEFIESGDRVVVLGDHHMTGAQTGESATVPFVHVFRMEDGRAIHFEDV